MYMSTISLGGSALAQQERLSASMTSEQVRAARAMLRMEQRELARLSGVTSRTIARIEALPGPVAGTFQTVERIKNVLESQGIVFTEDGVELKKPGTEPSDSDHPT